MIYWDPLFQGIFSQIKNKKKVFLRSIIQVWKNMMRIFIQLSFNNINTNQTRTYTVPRQALMQSSPDTEKLDNSPDTLTHTTNANTDQVLFSLTKTILWKCYTIAFHWKSTPHSNSADHETFENQWRLASVIFESYSSGKSSISAQMFLTQSSCRALTDLECIV